MAGYHHPAGSGAAAALAAFPPAKVRCGIWLLTAARRNDDYDPGNLDRLARIQRQRLLDDGALEASPIRVYKLRCQACLILIGPGYEYDDVWLDLSRDRWVCRSCAMWPSVDPVTVAPLATREEVADLSIGELGRLLKRRTKGIKQGSRQS